MGRDAVARRCAAGFPVTNHVFLEAGRGGLPARDAWLFHRPGPLPRGRERGVRGGRSSFPCGMGNEFERTGQQLLVMMGKVKSASPRSTQSPFGPPPAAGLVLPRCGLRRGCWRLRRRAGGYRCCTEVGGHGSGGVARFLLSIMVRGCCFSCSKSTTPVVPRVGD